MRSNPKLRFSKEARADLRDLRRKTERGWGARQREIYEAAFDEAFERLIAHPEIGRMRDEYFPGCRGLLVERHVIFYHLDGDDIVVDRVLHQNQDAASKLSQ